MAVKVIMKRVPKPGLWTNMNSVLRELRMLAMDQPGYLSGETLLSSTDRGTTLVIANWASVKDWRNHETSLRRKEIIDGLDSLLDEPATIEIWVESPVIG